MARRLPRVAATRGTEDEPARLAQAPPALLRPPRRALRPGNGYDEAIAETFPASDPPAEDHNDERGKPRHASTTMVEERAAEPVSVTVAAGLTGAVVRDPVQDGVAWREYLETVMKERDGWKDLYRACRDASE